MNSVMFAGGLERLIEVAFQAAPTILVGLVVSGVIRYLIGYEQMRRWFGGNLFMSLVKGWIIGMLLPVCSLGVLPVIREFQKAGIRGGTTLAFGLTAPLFNPISVLYGLTLSDPFTLFVFCMGSLTVVTALGIVWDRL
ncbi:MAG: permease, partial [Planctomycetota bacterium]|nr:permease [Planctomycetota bacterium]